MGGLADMPDSICADIIYLLSTWISIITAFYKASRQPWLTSFHRVVSTGWIIGIVLDCIVYSVYTEYTRLAPRLWAFVLQEWKLRVITEDLFLNAYRCLHTRGQTQTTRPRS